MSVIPVARKPCQSAAGFRVPRGGHPWSLMEAFQHFFNLCVFKLLTVTSVWRLQWRDSSNILCFVVITACSPELLGAH